MGQREHGIEGQELSILSRRQICLAWKRLVRLYIGYQPHLFFPHNYLEGLRQLHSWRRGLGQVVYHRELERVVGKAIASPQRLVPAQFRRVVLGPAIRLSIAQRGGVGDDQQAKVISSKTAKPNAIILRSSESKRSVSPAVLQVYTIHDV